MSLLIDVLTKADQAHSDEADRASTAAPEVGGTVDTRQAQQHEAVSELALAPDDDTPPAGEPLDAAPVTDAAGDGEDAPAPREPIAPVAESTEVGARGGSRPRFAARTGMLKLAALGGAAALVAAALLIGEWRRQASLTPIDYGEESEFAAASAVPTADRPAPTPDPANVGPPILRQRNSPSADDAVFVAEFPGTRDPATNATDVPDVPVESSANARIVIEKTDSEKPLHAYMRRAYEAFREGDYTAAIDAYRRALDVDPVNQDALLGLAALALRTGDAQQAARYFEATLDLDPQNSVAMAGLVALQEGGSPIDRESFLKNLLYERPTAAHLHFSLGIQFASQARWSDAQQAFFDAFSHDPSNADYAFNLAVSLDRLGQARSAADYYRRSLDLASGNHVIDTTAAQRRLDALTAGDGENPQ